MHLAARRGGAAVTAARSLRGAPGLHLQRRLPATASRDAFGSARSFSASSFSPRSLFGSSARAASSSAGSGSSGAAKAAAFFLDAQAACKNKRCALSKGVAAAPESCGEDSFFVAPTVVGVADGVGGWNENGVDPGEISRSLMRSAGAFVRQSVESGAEFTTQRVLAHAYAQALADESVEAGSTTACIVRVKESAAGTPLLEYSNLGDSGFVIIRDNVVIFRSKFQCYGRAPYQLAKIPPRFKSYGAIENQPRDADSGEIEVQDGDIIVLATDGVWDNFSPSLARAPSFQPPLVAWRRNWHTEIAGLVDVVAEDPAHAATNVVKASVRHNLKPDDVTVIVAKVVSLAPKL